MAYTTATLSLLNGLVQGGYNRWIYTTTDTITTVSGADYFDDAVSKGLGLGDIVEVIKTDGPNLYITQVTAIGSASATVTDTATTTSSSVTTTTLVATNATLTTATVNGVPPAESATVDPSQKVTYFDDFLAAALEARNSSTAGSGTANQALTKVTNSLNGEATLKTASDNGTDAANATNLTLDETNFKAGGGGLAFECRIKIDSAANAVIMVGFTDTISTTVELPIYKHSAADTQDSTATDACGIFYDTQGTTDTWTLGGVANDVDVTPIVHATLLPVAATYDTLRVEVSAAGAVTGYINGVSMGTIASAVRTTIALTPVIVVSNRTGAQKVLTIDYWWCQATRA